VRTSPNMPTRLHRFAACGVAGLLLLGSCSTDDPASDAPSTPLGTEPAPSSVDETVATTRIDGSLQREDVDCSEEGVGSTDTTMFSSARYVVDGVLGAVCFGPDEDVLRDAWSTLVAITPPLQLSDLAVFGGFASSEEGDEVTLAFVNVLDDDGTTFQMSVNLQEFVNDRDAALLTMAHEFSHVFTSTTTQIDRSSDAQDSCATYFNGEGCFLADSLMAQWIEEFWGDGLIDEIDPAEEASVADGQERCDLHPGFFGAYAASNPEEDFAESFSAFVFEVPAVNDEQQRKLDWIGAQPGLDEFHERAVAANLLPVAHEFDECGASS
jgi:hypothetical protein